MEFSEEEKEYFRKLSEAHEAYMRKQYGDDFMDRVLPAIEQQMTEDMLKQFDNFAEVLLTPMDIIDGAKRGVYSVFDRFETDDAGVLPAYEVVLGIDGDDFTLTEVDLGFTLKLDNAVRQWRKKI